MKILLHSYTFRDYPLEDAFRAADKFDYDGLELQRVHFNESYLETELPPALELAEKYTVPILCLDFTTDFMNEDPRAVDESVALLQKNIAICAQHGIRLMNGHTGVLVGDTPEDFGQNGSAMAKDAHFDRAAEALKRVMPTAEAHDVTLTLEIHMNTLHDTIAAMTRLLDAVDHPRLLATPDPGNMFATPHAERDPAALEALKGRIGLFHLKNCAENNGEYDYSPDLAEGHIDIRRYMHKLKDLGYNGHLCIEHVGPGDPWVSAERDIAYLRECIEQLKAE